MNHTSAVENNFLWVQILLWNKDDHHHENPERLESILLLYFFCLFCFLFSYHPFCPDYYRFLVLEDQVVQKGDSRYLDRILVPGLDHRQNWNSYSLLPKDHNFQSSVELMSPVYHDNIEEYMENRLWPGFHGLVDGNTNSEFSDPFLLRNIRNFHWHHPSHHNHPYHLGSRLGHWLD